MGKPLGSEGVTAKQRACYEMRKGGATWEEIARALGMGPETARGHVKRAVRNGLPPLLEATVSGWKAQASPEVARQVAHSLGAVAASGGEFDLKAFLEMAQGAGIPPRLATALGRRLAMNYGAVVEELKRLSNTELVAATQEKAQLVLSYIDDASIAGMNAKDLATAYGILTDKSLLLGGKPTQIIDFNARQQLVVLMPQFLAEAKRRGVTIDGTATVVQGGADADAGSAQKST